MREIKFRAWIKEYGFGGFMIPDDESDFFMVSNGDDFVVYDNENKPLDKDEFVIMQYTGLKDKNGKEIYDGDIVELRGITKGTNYETWRAKVVFDSNNLRYILVSKDTDGIMDFKTVMDLVMTFKTYTLAVIGNIYENQELLEG